MITESFIRRMRDTMIHRGVDGAGAWARKDGRAGLGHGRLSIIDLSDSTAQPMCNEDDPPWLSFNGEIYNHDEIRAQFRKKQGIEIPLHQWLFDNLGRLAANEIGDYCDRPTF